MIAESIQALYAFVLPELETQFGASAVAVENQPFDFDNLPDLWAELEVELEDADQIGMQENPKTRYIGCLRISCHSREGTGTLLATAKLANISAAVSYKVVDGVQIESGRIRNLNPRYGWSSKALEMSFHFDA